MFFSLSQHPETNFSHFYKLGRLHLSTDAGWHETCVGPYQVVYKGYADVDAMPGLLEQIVSQDEPLLLGNFCAVVYDSTSDTVRIQTDRYRSFPLYFKNQHSVNNLTAVGPTAWTDSLLEVSSDLTVTERKFDVIGEICSDPLSEDEVVDRINQLLDSKTKSFLAHNKLPIHTHLSGGVDSLLVYSYLQKFDQTHKVIDYAHIDYDDFWLKNSGTLQQYWGYRQIHHWRTPCVLTSGAPGDEFMLRSPATGDLFAQFYGESVEQLLDTKEWGSCLHSTYFRLPKNYKIFQDQLIDSTWNTPEKLMYNLCNIVVNDWQHWHLGNTLTWTPLRDLEIFKLMLRLPVESAIGQLMNSNISLRLIEQNYPGLTSVISTQKNTNSEMSNLCNFLREHCR